MRFAIACRGSVAEGLGHLFRAYSFARIAQAQHDIDVFVLADPGFAQIFSDISADVRFVADETELAQAVARSTADAVVLDMLDIGDDAFNAIRKTSAVVATISPIFRLAEATDLYFTRGKPPVSLRGPRIFAGLDYAILNHFCKPIPDEQYEYALSSPALPLMVSFGGADADNHTRLVLETLRDVESPLLIWLMLGDGYLHSHDDLVEAIRATSHHEIILARTNRSMWQVARNCALAIVTSGMSTLEAIFAGLPVISIKRSAESAMAIETDYDSLILPGGDFNDGSYRSIKDIVSALILDRSRLVKMRRNQQNLIDGLGGVRVVDAIERHVPQLQRRRPAS